MNASAAVVVVEGSMVLDAAIVGSEEGRDRGYEYGLCMRIEFRQDLSREVL